MNYYSILKTILWNPKLTHNERVSLIKLLKQNTKTN